MCLSLMFIFKRLTNTNNNFTKRLNHWVKYGRTRGSSIKGQNCDSTNELILNFQSDSVRLTTFVDFIFFFKY